MVTFTWDVAWLPAGLGVVLSSLSRSRDRRSKIAVIGVVVSYAALVVTAVVAVTASLGALTV
jgi:hypothetical protein